MATFRNNQIDEILNNERNMNRVILDRASAHVSSIGDERAPKTVRDVKNEARIGGLIDALKEAINKAIQKISGYQYGRATEKNTARNLKLNTNKNPESKTEKDKEPDLDTDDEEDELNGNLAIEAVGDNAVPDID
jgi:hypothetical protein